MNQESPFQEKSTKTPRSPVRQASNPREPSLKRDDRTRKQVTALLRTRPKNNSESDIEQTTGTTENATTQTNKTPRKTDKNTQTITSEQHAATQTATKTKPTYDTQTQTSETERNTTTQTETSGETPITSSVKANGKTPRTAQQYTTHPDIRNPQQTNMNIQQIQQQIAAMVQEFSGINSGNRPEELSRFTEAADMIYSMLTTEEEKENFSKLIRFRLRGDAYTKINGRQPRNYLEMKNTLRELYTTTYALQELDRQFIEIRQNYNEPLRDYGYRINEAMEKYKRGYEIKYDLPEVDGTYAKHLNTTAVQIFKKGLMNNILKEKIITNKATSINEILNDTEEIEKSLTMMTNTTNSHTQEQQIQPAIRDTQQNHTVNTQPRNPNPIICNYCQKPNHTWDKCRTRMFKEGRAQQNTQFNRTNNYTQNEQYNPQRQQIRPQPNIMFRNYDPRPMQTHFTNGNNHRNDSYDKYTPVQRSTTHTPIPNYREQYREPTNYQRRPAKYCSHCKTTTGHTFEECRSKFYTEGSQNPPNHNKQQQPQKSDNLENIFENLRINRITPHPQIDTNDQQQYTLPMYQGNSTGSSQQ